MTLIGYTCTASSPRNSSFGAKQTAADKTSTEQDIARRLKALKKAGCTKIIHDYTLNSSGRETYRRTELSRALSRLLPGDTLIVTNFACAAWSLPRLIELLTTLRERGIVFRTLEGPFDNADLFRALERPTDTSGSQGPVVLAALQAILAFLDALHRPARPQSPPAASPTKRLQVIQLATKLKTEHPEVTLQEIADELKRLGYKPPRGGPEWDHITIKRILARARLTGILTER